MKAGLKAAQQKVISYARVSAITQEPNENPIAFLVRLKEALQKFTNLDLDSYEGRVILFFIFFNFFKFYFIFKLYIIALVLAKKKKKYVAQHLCKSNCILSLSPLSLFLPATFFVQPRRGTTPS